MGSDGAPDRDERHVLVCYFLDFKLCKPVILLFINVITVARKVFFSTAEVQKCKNEGQQKEEDLNQRGLTNLPSLRVLLISIGKRCRSRNDCLSLLVAEGRRNCECV